MSAINKADKRVPLVLKVASRFSGKNATADRIEICSIVLRYYALFPRQCWRILWVAVVLRVFIIMAGS